MAQAQSSGSELLDPVSMVRLVTWERHYEVRMGRQGLETFPEVRSASFWPIFGGRFEGWAIKRQLSTLQKRTPWSL